MSELPEMVAIMCTSATEVVEILDLYGSYGYHWGSGRELSNQQNRNYMIEDIQNIGRAYLYVIRKNMVRHGNSLDDLTVDGGCKAEEWHVVRANHILEFYPSRYKIENIQSLFE